MRSLTASKSWDVDARERLRLYLEQRRELGESELVLDSLSIDEVMALISGRSRRAPHEVEIPLDVASVDWRQALRAADTAPAAPGETPAGPAGPSVFTNASIVPAASDADSCPSITHLVAAIASCTRCPLYATATNPVPGEGNPNADFMCVGEAPGATEDETGRPFVGAAGQLLTKILEAINLRREDVFICNVLKHRPPGNRNPLPEEVKACSPYLIRQIELVKPKIILALGTFAAQTLLDTKISIGKLRGQIHSYHGVPLVVTYHPAALLRNPSWKRPTWEDVQLARRILDNSGPNSVGNA